MKPCLSKTITMLGYFVFRKTTKTSNGKIMYFGTFIDEDGAFLDTIHFPPSAQHHPFQGVGVYQLTGKVSEEFDFYSLESGYVAIEYIPRRDVGYTTEGWASERFIEPELVGPIHSTSAFVGSSLAAGSGFDVTPGIQGHSVKINNAGYSQNLFLDINEYIYSKYLYINPTNT